MTNGIGETVLYFLAAEYDITDILGFKLKGPTSKVKNNFGIPVLFDVAQLGYRERLL